MTTIAAPAVPAADFGAARAALRGNTTTVPMASPGRQRIEGTSTFQCPKRSPARFAPVMVNGALKIEGAKTSKPRRDWRPSSAHRRTRRCTTLRPCEPTRVARRRRPSPRNAGLTAVSIIRSGHRENERARGAGIGVGKCTVSFEKRSRRQFRASRPEQYYRIEKPLPFIYDESESKFPLRHNRATIFFIGQHGRVS